MTENELHKTIEQGEGYFTEFKRNINSALTEAKLSKANFEFSSFFSVVFDRENQITKTREKTREKIIQLIREDNKITTKILAQKVGITIKGIEYQLNKLKTENVIKRIGSDKGGYWEIINSGKTNE